MIWMECNTDVEMWPYGVAGNVQQPLGNGEYALGSHDTLCGADQGGEEYHELTANAGNPVLITQDGLEIR